MLLSVHRPVDCADSSKIFFSIVQPVLLDRDIAEIVERGRHARMNAAEHVLLNAERLGEEIARLIEAVLQRQSAAEHREVRRGAIAILAVPATIDLERPAIEAFR